MAGEGNDFMRLRSVDESFQRRSDFIFANLRGLEPTDENSGSVRREERGQRGSNRRRSVPNSNPRLPARVPDHVLSPEKWTKYSLKNDGTERFRGMNEHNLNTHAAQSFLDDLRKRRAEETEKAAPRPEERENETNISFRKPSSPKEKSLSSKMSAKGVWKNGSFVMPEYVAGVSRPKVAKARSAVAGKRAGEVSSAGCVKVSLGHLMGDGDDEGSVEEQRVTQRTKRVFKKRKMNEDDEKGNEEKEDGMKLEDNSKMEEKI